MNGISGLDRVGPNGSSKQSRPRPYVALRSQTRKIGEFEVIMETEIKTVKLTSISLNPDNPRRISNTDMDRLIKSLQDFPDMMKLREIVVDETMTVLGGNMRLFALRKIGARECTAKIVTGLTAEQKREFVIKDNSGFGEWDMDALANAWVALPLVEWGVDLPDGWLTGSGEVIEDDFDAEAEAEKIIEPVTKVGDVWLLGRHWVMCGDSTKKEDVGRLMGPQRANMVFTDPPYNVNYGANKIPGHKSRKILNDHLSNDEWIAFNKAVIGNIKDYYSGGDLYIWGASGPDGMRQRLLLIEMGFHWSATIVWKKQQLVLSPAKYQRMYEPCFYGWLDKSTFQGDRKQTEVWSFDRPLNSKLHPTMKPIAV